MTTSGPPHNALKLLRGHIAADFAPGRIFAHAQRKTLTAGDHALFTALTLHYNPAYLDITRARELGYREMPVNSLLIFNMVFGISVEDLSEGGGPFLGVDDLNYETPAYVGDTVRATSTVISRRDSNKYDQYAIVSWTTEGYNQKGERLIRFQRTNLVRRSR
jgi:itaconyl-CoA hydratase